MEEANDIRSVADKEKPCPGPGVITFFLLSFAPFPSIELKESVAEFNLASLEIAADSKLANKTDINNIITATAEDNAETNPSIIYVTKH
ncbi:hypothetical protein N6D82_004351 [Salmonella enterica]|nr:hypothetical protein [Salmonella enterica]EJV4167368.1 hypothetical protein [Salmonella enterica]